ncbi:hypothetical protein EON67_07965 [archaeon]|nr:MAG: hypothetical protein EON67_07965 [archaeon]
MVDFVFAGSGCVARAGGMRNMFHLSPCLHSLTGGLLAAGAAGHLHCDPSACTPATATEHPSRLFSQRADLRPRATCAGSP